MGRRRIKCITEQWLRLRTGSLRRQTSWGSWKGSPRGSAFPPPESPRGDELPTGRRTPSRLPRWRTRLGGLSWKRRILVAEFGGARSASGVQIRLSCLHANHLQPSQQDSKLKPSLCFFNSCKQPLYNTFNVHSGSFEIPSAHPLVWASLLVALIAKKKKSCWKFWDRPTYGATASARICFVISHKRLHCVHFPTGLKTARHYFITDCFVYTLEK